MYFLPKLFWLKVSVCHYSAFKLWFLYLYLKAGKRYHLVKTKKRFSQCYYTTLLDEGHIVDLWLFSPWIVYYIVRIAFALGRVQKRLTVLIYLKVCNLLSDSCKKLWFHKSLLLSHYVFSSFDFGHLFLCFRSFDPRRECNLRKYSYLLPAEIIGIKSNFGRDEVDYHLSDFNDILNAFEVWYTCISFSPLLM